MNSVERLSAGLCLVGSLSIMFSCVNTIPETRPLSEKLEERQVFADKDPTDFVYHNPDSITGVNVSTLYWKDDLNADIYYPAEFDGADQLPFVVIIPKGGDSPENWRYEGLRQMDKALYVSWAALLASNGIIGITFETIDENDDVGLFLEYLYKEGKSFGIDRSRAGFLSDGEGGIFLYELLGDGESKLIQTARAAAFYYKSGPYSGSVPVSSDLSVLIVDVGLTAEPMAKAWSNAGAQKLLDAGLTVDRLSHPDAGAGFEYLENDSTTIDIIQGTVDFFQKALE